MAQNILYTDITKAYYPKSPYILNIDNKNYPNINAGYGPYSSQTDATTALKAIYNVTALEDIPDGVQVTYYDSKKTTLGFYLLVSGQFLSVGSGGGNSPTTNVISNYIFNISNPRIVVPVQVDSDGKYWTTPEALKEASTTTISISNNTKLIDIDDDTVNLYTASTGGNNSGLKLSTITNTNKSYSFYLEFDKDVTDGTLYEITSQVFFLAFSLNGLQYQLIQSVVLDTSGWVYSLGSSDQVLRIDTNNNVQDLTIDIDSFNIRLEKSEKVSKDYITLEYIYDGDIYYINKDLIDGTAPTVSDSGQIRFTANTQVYKTSKATTGDTYKFSDLATNSTSDMHFSHGDSIIIKITKGGITDYRTIIVNRASAYTGVFVSPNAFVLDRNNIIIPNTYKDNDNQAYLQQATKTKAYYYEGVTPYIATIESVTLSDESAATYTNTGTEVQLDTISDDLSITYKVSYSGNEGTLVQNVSFTKADSYYVLKAQTSTIPLTDELKPVSDTDLSFVIDKVQTGKTEVIDSAADANTAGLVIKRYKYDSNGATTTTISIPDSSVEASGLIDALSDLEENGITSGSYIEYSLYNSSNEYLAGTRVYFVKAGANGTSAHILDLDNDVIVVDDDVDDDTLRKVSETVVTPSEDVSLYYTITGQFLTADYASTSVTRYIKLSTTSTSQELTTYEDARVFSYKTVASYPSLSVYLTNNTQKVSPFQDINVVIQITYSAYTDSALTNLYAIKKQTLKVSEIGGTYKLSISPNIVPLNNAGTQNLINNNLATQDLTVSVYKYGKKGTFTNITDLSGEGLKIVNNSTEYTTTTISSYPISNIVSGKSDFYLKTSDGIILDSETVGFTKTGANGDPNLSIDFTNPTVVIDDQLSDSTALDKVLSNTATCYYGTSKVAATWRVQLSSDLTNLFKDSIGNNYIEYTSATTTITPGFKLKTEGALNTTTTGYITYTATYNNCSISRQQNIIIKDISADGSSYKLIAYPNILSCDYTGKLNAGSTNINLQLLKINGDGTGSSSMNLNGYYVTTNKIGNSNLTEYSNVTSSISFTESYYEQGYLLSIWKTCAAEGYYTTQNFGSISPIIYPNTLTSITYNGTSYNVVLLPYYSYNSTDISYYIPVLFLTSYTIQTISPLSVKAQSSGVYVYTNSTPLNGSTSEQYKFFDGSNIVNCSDFNTSYPTNYCAKTVDDLNTINSYSDLIDSTTIKFTKDGAPGEAGSTGISVQQSNDFFMVDDDTTVLNEDVTKNTIHVFQGSKELAYTTDYTISKTDISYTSASGSSGDSNGVITVNRTDNTTTLSITSGKTLVQGSGCVIYTITPGTTNLFTEFQVQQNFQVVALPDNYSYSLSVSPNVFNYDDTTASNEFSFIINKYSTDGSIEELEYKDYCGIANASLKDGDIGVFIVNTRITSSTYSSKLSSATTFTLKVRYKSNWVTVDSETVGVVYNGNDSTVPGAAIRFMGIYDSTIKYLFNEYDDADTSTDKVKYIDVVKYNSYYYQKKAPSVKGTLPVITGEDGTAATNTTYWIEANQYDLLITKELLVTDDDGIITGGVVGGTATGSTNDIVIWAGSNTNSKNKYTSASDATFYVTDKGEVHAKKFIGEGIYNDTITTLDFSQDVSDYFFGNSDSETGYYHLSLVKAGGNYPNSTGMLDLTKVSNSIIISNLTADTTITLPYALIGQYYTGDGDDYNPYNAPGNGDIYGYYTYKAFGAIPMILSNGEGRINRDFLRGCANRRMVIYNTSDYYLNIELNANLIKNWSGTQYDYPYYYSRDNIQQTISRIIVNPGYTAILEFIATNVYTLAIDSGLYAINYVVESNEDAHYQNTTEVIKYANLSQSLGYFWQSTVTQNDAANPEFSLYS